MMALCLYSYFTFVMLIETVQTTDFDIILRLSGVSESIFSMKSLHMCNCESMWVDNTCALAMFYNQGNGCMSTYYLRCPLTNSLAHTDPSTQT